MIIGISGKLGSGKDTVGKIIQYLDYYNKRNGYETSCREFLNATEKDYSSYKHIINGTNWEIKKFAGKLKQIVSILTGITLADLEREEIKNSQLPEYWHKFDENNHYLEPDTVREVLQKIGTEVGRHIHQDIWVNALISEYIKDIPMSFPNWVITDMRFPNELKAIKDRDGITIRINRDIVENHICKHCGVKTTQPDYLCYKAPKEHLSETALDNADFDYIINNNSTIEDLIKQVKEILIKENIIK